MKIDTDKLMKFSTPDAAFAEMMGANKRDIQQLPIEQLLPYPSQPFRPYTEDKLTELAEDIALNGILSPVIVRSHEAGYQILAGHNRVAAAKLIKLETVPCIIKEVTDNEAQLILVTTNLNQRQGLMPSEKAFAYKMQLEAIVNQGATNCRTLIVVAEQNSENKRQIQRYIRLANLIKPLLDMVDTGKLPMMAGVNLSYLSNEQQEIVYDFVDAEEKRISLKISEQIKDIAAANELTDETIFKIFYKPTSTKTYLKLSFERVSKVLPKSLVNDDDREEYIMEALEFYNTHAK